MVNDHLPGTGTEPVDRTYVVTGAASGIGSATTRYCRERGGRVIACDLHDADVIADLTTAEGRAALVDGVTRLSDGRIDAIVANAGGGPPETSLSLNFFGAVATLEQLRPLLKASSAPRAVAVSSVAALQSPISTLGNFHALLIASSLTIAWAIIGFSLTRRLDALSILPLAGLGLALLAFAVGAVARNARLVQLRGQLAMAAVGLLFLVSAAIGKPLIYQLARARIKRRSPAKVASFEAMRDNPAFRRAMMIMTLAWGTSLVIEPAISYVLSLVLTVEQNLLVNPIIGYASIGALTAWTYWYAQRATNAARQH